MLGNNNKRLTESSSERKFQTLFNFMPLPMVIVDAKGNLLAVNNSVEKVTGFKREELLGKNFLGTKIVTMKSDAHLEKNLAQRMKGTHGMAAATLKIQPSRTVFRGHPSTGGAPSMSEHEKNC